MKTLYYLTLSSGLPRQRTYRHSHSMFVSGVNQYDAGRIAIDNLRLLGHLQPGHVARVDGVRGICATPDDVYLTGTIYSRAGLT